MTDQSTPNRLNRASNAVFEATSFLNGTNAAYVEQLYARYLSDPNSVEQGWQTYFAQLGEKDLTPTQLGRGPAWKRDSRPALANGELVAALTGQEPPASAKGPGKKAAAMIKATSVIVMVDVDASKVSARNAVSGKVSDIKKGAVNTDVTITDDSGLAISAIITNSSADRLGLAVGKAAVAVFKASSVIVAVD